MNYRRVALPLLAATLFASSDPIGQLAKRPGYEGPCYSFVGEAYAGIPETLKGSRAAMNRENYMANRDGLSRISNDAVVKRMVNNSYLVKLSDCTTYDYDGKKEYSYTRPWTRVFVERLSDQFYRRFGRRLKITSAVRPISYQNALRKRNGNASKRSTHPTGATIDITYKGLNKKQKQWMRNTLSSCEWRGDIQATEESSQSCFHFFVGRNYRPHDPRAHPPVKHAPAKKHGKR